MDDNAQLPDDDGFAAVLAEYLKRLDCGENVARQKFLEEHPQHAAALREFFEDVDVVERLHPVVLSGAESLPNGVLRECDDFKLLRVIGRGGTGIVYRASKRVTGEVVALKMLLHGLLLSPSDVQRFRNEVATAASLDHPGIVPIYDVGEFQGHLYYTMPFLTGGSLAHRLAAGPMPVRAAAEMTLAIAEGLDFAHQRGVIHRDLKPANVLLDEQGTPHLGDFGLARQLTSRTFDITRTGELLGTPNYMAPEQVMGRRSQVGPAVDIYAIGAVLYALLVGRPPFQSKSIAETLHKINSADPVSPRQLNREVPPGLETICLKCLEKSPADRYNSAAALVADLRRFLSGDRPAARRASSFELARRWFIRNPVVGMLIAAICLTMLVGSGVSLFYAQQARQRERIAQTNLYAADMNLAQQHLRSGAVDSALKLLERHRPVADGEAQPPWEWRYLWHQCHGELRRFAGPSGAVYAAAFSPDGRTVAAAGEDKTLWLWETATGNVKFKLAGHTAAIRDLAFAPDGKRFATVGEDGRALIWDTATGHRLAELKDSSPRSGEGRGEGHSPLTTIAVSPDGRWIATGGSDEVKVNLWDASTHALQSSLDLGPAESVAFSPDSARLAIAGRDGSVRVCERDENGAWELKATIQAHAHVVRKVAWSPDGTRLATAGSDNTVKTWDARSWNKLVGFSDFGDAVYCLAFRPDGKRLVMAARNEPLKVWDFNQKQLVAELVGHSALVTSTRFCPEGWRLLSACEDGTVRLWDVAQSTDHDCLEGSFSRVRAMEFSPDGKSLATGTLDTGDNILWQVQSSLPQLVLHSLWPRKVDLTFSPDGKFLASVGQTRLQIWSAGDRKLTLDIELPGASLAGVAWAPSGDRIAVQNEDGTIRILDARSGSQLSTWVAPARPHGTIAYSPDGAALATTGWDGKVRVWHVATGSLRFELVGHAGPVVHVAFSPNGSLIASSAIDDTIRLWDAKTGRHLHTLAGHSGTAMGLAFNPDSTRLASTSTDRLVKLWDVATGLELQSLTGHRDWGLEVAFSPDGQTLASGGGDGTVRIWHAPSLNSPPRYSGSTTRCGEEGSGERRVEGPTLREATALVKHLVAQLTAADRPVSDDPTTRAKLLEVLTADPTISDPVRVAATAQAKDYLLYWLPMCNGYDAAQRGDWPQAIAAFERAAALAPHDISLWRLLALASAAGGRTDAYESACRGLTDRFADNAEESDLANIVVVALLMPPNGRDLTPIRPLVDAFAEHSEIGQSYAVLYQLRSGERNRVVDAVNSRPFNIPPRPEACFIMSLAWLQAGDKQRATTLYDAGSKMARDFAPTNWVAAAVSDPLQREAAAILGIEPTGSEGNPPPTTPIAPPSSASQPAETPR